MSQVENMVTGQLDQALANHMLQKAIAYCGDRKFGGDAQEAERALRQGRCDICGLLCPCLIQEVGQYLGRTDRMIKAVYQVEPEAALARPQDGLSPSLNRRGGINLVAWVD